MIEPEAPATEPAQEAPQDSVTFTRCSVCKYAHDVDPLAGLLLCKQYNMRCNAEIGAIPDDCLHFEPAETKPAESE